jgi:polysaccharide export outer membrane protein
MRQLLLAGGVLLAAHFALFPQSPALQTREPAYLLQPGDSVEVQYRYTPEFNAKVLVQPDGGITLPIAGAIRVGGLSVDQARAAIAAKAGERLRDPELTLLLTDFVKPAFTVAGEIARPGRYEFRGSITAMDAIAISGGITESSKHSQILLVRRVNAEFADVLVLDLKQVMRADGIQEDVRVRDGDLIIVPKSIVSKLERYIRWGSLYALWRR